MRVFGLIRLVKLEFERIMNEEMEGTAQGPVISYKTLFYL